MKQNQDFDREEAFWIKLVRMTDRYPVLSLYRRLAQSSFVRVDRQVEGGTDEQPHIGGIGLTAT